MMTIVMNLSRIFFCFKEDTCFIGMNNSSITYRRLSPMAIRYSVNKCRFALRFVNYRANWRMYSAVASVCDRCPIKS